MNTSETALESGCRRYAVGCPRDRLAATYEFASMLDGYDPRWWKELMKLRGCGEMSGKPRKGKPDADPNALDHMLPASSNVEMVAKSPIVDALAGATVYTMEVDDDIATPSDVGLGLAVCLTHEDDEA